MNGGQTNYRDLALLYVRAGYLAPIPLPQGQKHPPPSGFTGHYNTGPPSAAQIQEWRRERGEDGIGFVLQDGWLLIDVDNYAKGEWPEGTGAATIAAAGELAGCGLPAGPKLRNRADGSEKRLFWVPPGLKFRKSLGPCVDLVTPSHRYVNVGINPDTGNPEQWFDAEDKLLDAPPPIETQRKLPDAWLALVIEGVGEGSTSLATEEQARAWFDDMPEGPIGCLIKEELDHALAGLDGRCPNPKHDTRHDCCQEHVRWMVQCGAAGLTGAKTALGSLRKRFVEAVKEDRGGGIPEAEREFDAMLAWGARVVRPDEFYALRGLDCTGGELRIQVIESEAESPANEAAELPSWAPVDIRVARESRSVVLPTILRRSDGPCLFYRGKIHSVHGETESGKSWLAQCATAECLLAREPVLYLDFEDDAGAVAERLIRLGVPLEIVENPALFAYVHPEAPPTTEREGQAFEVLLNGNYSLSVVDGVTDSMALFGLSGMDADDVARWHRELPKAIAHQTGAAVICVDHVAKDSQTRGRFALGSQHKIAGLSGAAYVVEMAQPFAVGQAGRASVRVGKDRPGRVRGLGGRWRKLDRTQHVADLLLDSTDAERTKWALEPPQHGGSPSDVHDSKPAASKTRFRPTWYMEQVSGYWEETDDPAMRTNTKTVDAMCLERKEQGKTQHRNHWRDAIKLLEAEGFAQSETGARDSSVYTVVKPYRQQDDPLSDEYVEASTDVENWKAQLETDHERDEE